MKYTQEEKRELRKVLEIEDYLERWNAFEQFLDRFGGE